MKFYLAIWYLWSW